MGPAKHEQAAPPGAGEAPSPVAPSGTLLDTVELKDGALYRGTLLEWVPDSHALLLLHDGSTRRFETAALAHVTAASESAARAGARPTAAPAEHAGLSAEALESAAAGTIHLTVHTSAGQALFAQSALKADARLVCTASCATTIARGDYLLGLSRDGSHPVMSKHWTHLDRDLQLDGTLHRARAARIVGGSILGVGVPLGLGLLGGALAARKDGPDCADRGDDCGKSKGETLPMLAVGAFVAVLSTLLGVFLVTRRNSVEFQSYPDNDTTESLAEPALEPPAP